MGKLHLAKPGSEQRAADTAQRANKTPGTSSGSLSLYSSPTSWEVGRDADRSGRRHVAHDGGCDRKRCVLQRARSPSHPRQRSRHCFFGPLQTRRVRHAMEEQKRRQVARLPRFRGKPPVLVPPDARKRARQYQNARV
eukprot:936484-Rhodomonas_salina.2